MRIAPELMPQNGITLSLGNKVAVVTGGSRGIGAATVKMFVAAGARVMFNFYKNKPAADEVVHACGKETCAAIQVNLDDTASPKKLIQATVGRFGRLDILVANHGVWPPQDVAVNQMSDAQWRRTVAINLDSVFGLVKHAVAQMKKQRSGGKIVLVSSTAGQRGEAYHCDYAAAKGAVISMVKGLSTELAGNGIYVNCVAPGWVDTDMAAPALNDRDVRRRVLDKIPLARVARPEEIAAPILFLCTEHAGFITGEVFNVNGGAVLVG
jgi:3-oxoacyl-[acyl-carrier protein] reductase